MMAPLFIGLNLTIGCIQSDMKQVDVRQPMHVTLPMEPIMSLVLITYETICVPLPVATTGS